jgi:hypothetical protein
MLSTSLSHHYDTSTQYGRVRILISIFFYPVALDILLFLFSRFYFTLRLLHWAVRSVPKRFSFQKFGLANISIPSKGNVCPCACKTFLLLSVRSIAFVCVLVCVFATNVQVTRYCLLYTGRSRTELYLCGSPKP